MPPSDADIAAIRERALVQYRLRYVPIRPQWPARAETAVVGPEWYGLPPEPGPSRCELMRVVRLTKIPTGDGRYV